MKKIYVPYKEKTYAVLVDDDDYDYLAQFKWYIKQPGYVWRHIIRNGKDTTITMHREVMKAISSQEVDHINHNKQDNQKNNLRIVSRSENCQHQQLQPKNKSGARGVYWDKFRNQWVASVRHQKKHYGKRCSSYDDAVLEAISIRQKLGFLSI